MEARKIIQALDEELTKLDGNPQKYLADLLEEYEKKKDEESNGTSGKNN